MKALFSVEKSGGRRLVRFLNRKLFSCRIYPAVLDRIEGMLQWQVDSVVLARSGIKVPEEVARAWTGEYEIDEICLGSLFRMWDGRKIPLDQTMLVKFLRSGDEQILDEYERLHVEAGIATPVYCKLLRTTGLQTFERIMTNGYDPAISCICIFPDGLIADGYHRCAALYVKHGPEHRIRVLRILNRK